VVMGVVWGFGVNGLGVNGSGASIVGLFGSGFTLP